MKKSVVFMCVTMMHVLQGSQIQEKTIQGRVALLKFCESLRITLTKETNNAPYAAFVTEYAFKRLAVHQTDRRQLITKQDLRHALKNAHRVYRKQNRKTID